MKLIEEYKNIIKQDKMKKMPDFGIPKAEYPRNNSRRASDTFQNPS